MDRKQIEGFLAFLILSFGAAAWLLMPCPARACFEAVPVGALWRLNR
jgi:hypothetical protein